MTRKTKAGFTLLEMLVAIGIFAVMSIAIMTAFVSGFSTYRGAKELQRDVESAQYMMNAMAKYLRTGTVVSPSSPTADAEEIRFYDHSSSRCFEYRLQDGRFQARWKSFVLDPGDDIASRCDTGGMTAWADLTSGYVTGAFRVIPSDKDPGDKSIGRVTIQITVKEGEDARFESSLQTSVSLRDYGYVEY